MYKYDATRRDALITHQADAACRLAIDRNQQVRTQLIAAMNKMSSSSVKAENEEKLNRKIPTLLDWNPKYKKCFCGQHDLVNTSKRDAERVKFLIQPGMTEIFKFSTIGLAKEFNNNEQQQARPPTVMEQYENYKQHRQYYMQQHQQKMRSYQEYHRQTCNCNAGNPGQYQYHHYCQQPTANYQYMRRQHNPNNQYYGQHQNPDNFQY